MASVKFRLKTPQAATSIIVVRFYCNTTGPVDFSTGETIPPQFWEGQRVNSKYKKQHDRINKHLSQIEADLFDCWRDNKGLDPDTLKSRLRQAVHGHLQTEKKTVIEALKKFISQYEKEKEIGTVKRYRSLLSKLEQFNPNVTFEQLDFNFYDAFKTWLYGNTNPVYGGYHLERGADRDAYVMVADRDDTDNSLRPGLFDDVVFKYFINLKTLCAWAEKRGYVVHQAYKGWEILKREYPVIALTQDELHRIEELTFSANERHLDVARDYLCLECRTGQRISDLRRFNRSDITGNLWTFNQKKGARLNQKTVSLPLVGFCAPALLILQKYNYELPKISEQKINKHIKTICQKAGIDSPISITRWAGNRKVNIEGPKHDYISTHTGRKTFITIALGFLSPQMVMNITGIRSYATLRHYAGDSEIGLVEEGLRKIEDERSIMKKAN